MDMDIGGLSDQDLGSPHYSPAVSQAFPLKMKLTITAYYGDCDNGISSVAQSCPTL